MGARLRAEFVILAVIRILSARRELSVEEVSEATGLSSDFVREALSSFGITSGELKYEDLPAIVIKAWTRGFPLLELAINSGWSTLEELVRALLREHGFTCRRSIYIKLAGRRYEVDLLAWKRDILLCIDCKRWARVRASALRQAALNQKRRCDAVARLIETCEMPCLSSAAEVNVFPVVVSLHPAEKIVHEGVLMVSIYSFADIIRDISPLLLTEIGAEPLRVKCANCKKKQI